MISDLNDLYTKIKEKVQKVDLKEDKSMMTFEEYLAIKKEKSFKIKD